MNLNLKELLSEYFQPPECGHLFHYTDNNGFLGIVKDKVLWATHSGHMNDRSEFRHAREIVHTLVEKRIKQEQDDRKRNMLCLMARYTGSDNKAPGIGLVSFSKNGDMLSQWRAYGKNSGYAISFDFEELRKKAEEKKWLLVRCEYNEEKKNNLLNKLIDIAFERPPETNNQFLDTVLKNSDFRGLINISEILYQVALIFKDSGFKEEQEWRLIASGVKANEEIKYRPGRSGIIPYLEFDIKTDPDCHPIIDGVIVGPRQEIDLAVETARMVFSTHTIKHYPLPAANVSPALAKPSKIPYREW